MAEERTQRRLAAILAADVVGYSRLMQQDEIGTLAALKERRRKILEPLVARHHGRVFKVAGDGVLVEFGSAVNAVECSVDLQREMAAANRDLPEERQVVLRIGINLGDVIIEGGDLYGDGVNIAARLEAIAEPGGIVISGTARHHVLSKIKVGFEDLGAQILKNIAEPVRAYRIAGTPAVAVAKPASDKPSIAVLPFGNMSGDPGQQYFSDGITEDIITELSRFRSLFVIARNSSFRYRAYDVDVRRIGRELGVQFVVEGSVRRAAERLRITAQLIDANSGDHVWAERYDRDIQDVFAIQDEVARTIAATLEGRVAASVVEKVKRKPTQDWLAYDHFLQGRERDSKYDLAGAEACYARALVLDPGYGHAHAFRAIALAVMHWGSSEPELLRRAEASAQTALSIDAHDAWSHYAASYVALCQSKFDMAVVHSERALSLNPNDVMISAENANLLVRMGKPQEALQRLDSAMRLDPFPAAWVWEIRFRALFHLNRYHEAIAALSNVSSHVDWHHVYFAAAFAHSGRLNDARAAVTSFLEAEPAASISLVAEAEPYSDRQLLEHLLDGLRKAGLPE